MSDDKNDDFMEIINSNNMQDFMSESSSVEIMTVRDLHLGLKFMAEAMMYITSFIDEFYVAVSEDSEEDSRPGLTVDSVVLLKNMFENCQEFCLISLVEEDYDEDDFEDDDDDESGDE